MDVTRVKAAIDGAIKELNTVTDAVVKGGAPYKGITRLNGASSALLLAQKHLDTAAKQTAVKAAPAAKK